jgi:hypothetical protein
MLNVILLNVIILNVIMLDIIYAECLKYNYCGEGHYVEYHGTYFLMYFHI